MHGAGLGTVDLPANLVGQGGSELTLHSCPLVEDGGDGTQRSVGDGMTVGPLLPGGERSDAHPVFADGWCHGIESVDRVAGPELFVGVALVGNRPGLALDRGPRSLASACQVVLGPFELPLGHDEFVAGGAPLTTRFCREATLGAGVDSSSIDGSSFGGAEGLAVIARGGCDLGQRRIGGGDGGGRLGPSC